MIKQQDIIITESFRPLCTYDAVKDNLENIPSNGICWVPNDAIRDFFILLQQGFAEYKGPYIIIGTSDFGLHLQAEHPVNRDILKAISRIDFEKDYFNVCDKYLTLHIKPQCIVDQCDIIHKYSLKCYHYTHATFNEIPKQVYHWYSSNLNIIHPKCSCIPLGILKADHQFNFRPHDKKKLCYVNFSDITVERLELKRKLSRPQYSNWVTFKDKVSIDEYYKDIEDHLFILCPAGNSMDTFRVWETFMSGSIAVMELSNWSQQFNDLPILYVKSLFDVSKELLESAAKELVSAKFNLERATYGYWRREILNKWQEAQNQNSP